MAKALQTWTPAGAGDPQAWLAEVLRLRFAEVLACQKASADPERIDGVHDMRVAIRRLRSVIRDFAEIAEKFALKHVRKDLKHLADSLGAVRDADVAIRELQRFRSKAEKTEVGDGIDILISRLCEARNRAFAALLPQLSAGNIETLREHFETAMEGATIQRNLFAAADLDEAVGEIVANRVNDFLRLADSLYAPFRIRRLHQLRIAAKHLRYAVELFAGGGETEQSENARKIAKMQNYLGDVHDCDMWVAQLQTVLKGKKNKAAAKNERAAAAWLLSQFVRTRDKAYRAALALWFEWEETGFLETTKEMAVAARLKRNKH